MEQPWEVVFDRELTEDEKLAAFPERAALLAQELIDSRLAALETALHSYIYSHYAQSTQQSFTALYVGPSATPELKAAIEAAWVWVQSVLGQYYTLKAEIIAGKTPVIDFTPNDLSDPKVKLEVLLGRVELA